MDPQSPQPHQRPTGPPSASQPAAPLVPPNGCTLYPVRVDVAVGQEPSIPTSTATTTTVVRIVETLMIDPTCWPIPLTPPVDDAMEANIREYAHSIISDLEVLGMGKTARHFTNRVEMHTADLQKKVEDQLRPQLWEALLRVQNLPTRTKTERMTPIVVRLNVQGVEIKDSFMWDPNDSTFTVFDMAKQIAKEYNLNDEATVAVATTILEQIHGLVSVDASPDKTLPRDKRATIGAFPVEPKDQASFQQQGINAHIAPLNKLRNVALP